MLRTIDSQWWYNGNIWQNLISVMFSNHFSIIFNTLRLRQNDRYFPEDIFKWIFVNENVWISINISLKFVPRSPINNIPTLVQVMAWHRPGDKPLSEPMMVRLPMHLCITQPQWVNVFMKHKLKRNPFLWLLHEVMLPQTYTSIIK